MKHLITLLAALIIATVSTAQVLDIWISYPHDDGLHFYHSFYAVDQNNNIVSTEKRYIEVEDTTKIKFNSHQVFVKALGTGYNYTTTATDKVLFAGSDGRLKSINLNAFISQLNDSIEVIEVDPVFLLSAAYGITNTNITNWNQAFGWGNHGDSGYFVAANFNSSFDTRFGTKTTDNLTEGVVNLFFTQARARASFSAGIGISISGGGTISLAKRQETYVSTTNASGLVTITYGSAYGIAPNVQPSIVSTNPRESWMLEASTTTGCTVRVVLRADVLGLLPTYSNVSGREVNILVTEK